MKSLIIIPTYDERDNVRPIVATVLQAVPSAHILFVDDNSPDGTGKIVDEICAENPQVHVIHKEGKQGLGRAYITGFKWALANGYDLIFEMDADFSHNPKELPNFIKAAEQADLVIGSRYINGIRIMNWPMSRLLLSKTAATYVRIITGMPVFDPTGGFKCFRREVLENIQLESILSNGYAFQAELNYNTWLAGFRIKEIPIVFEDRHQGYSKMTSGIAKEALYIMLRLAFRHGFRRTPHPRPTPAT
jgi:dolichol-phosphate mannosyltransferase